MSQFESEFLEEYKKLDDLIDDVYKTYSGVSDYIKKMETNSFSGRRIIFDWDITFKQLKHVKELKDRLINKENVICSEKDVEFLIYFYDNIVNGEDPLAEFAYLQPTRPVEKEENFEDIFVEIPSKDDFEQDNQKKEKIEELEKTKPDIKKQTQVPSNELQKKEVISNKKNNDKPVTINKNTKQKTVKNENNEDIITNPEQYIKLIKISAAFLFVVVLLGILLLITR